MDQAHVYLGAELMPKIKLVGPRQREYAMHALRTAPDGAIVSITEAKRSTEQNSKLWAMLADIARDKPEGRQWTPETWKCALMHSLGHQVAFAEGLDGAGPFPIGFRSSRLTVAQMSLLIECAYEYGTRHGVVWRETDRSGWNE